MEGDYWISNKWNIVHHNRTKRLFKCVERVSNLKSCNSKPRWRSSRVQISAYRGTSMYQRQLVYSLLALFWSTWIISMVLIVQRKSLATRIWLMSLTVSRLVSRFSLSGNWTRLSLNWEGVEGIIKLRIGMPGTHVNDPAIWTHKELDTFPHSSTSAS